jgi:hypothetical protein
MSTPTPPPRRRFKRRYVVGLVLAVMVSGAAAWMNRPLNFLERRLVGSWIMDVPYHPQRITFDSTRTFKIEGVGGGRWRTDGQNLIMKDNTPCLYASFWLQVEGQLTRWIEPARSTPIRFRDENHISIANADYIRVPTP